MYVCPLALSRLIVVVILASRIAKPSFGMTPTTMTIELYGVQQRLNCIVDVIPKEGLSGWCQQSSFGITTTKKMKNLRPVLA